MQTDADDEAPHPSEDLRLPVRLEPGRSDAHRRMFAADLQQIPHPEKRSRQKEKRNSTHDPRRKESAESALPLSCALGGREDDVEWTVGGWRDRHRTPPNPIIGPMPAQAK